MRPALPARSRIALSLLAAALLHPVAQATVIVLLVSKDRIVISADTLLRGVNTPDAYGSKLRVGAAGAVAGGGIETVPALRGVMFLDDPKVATLLASPSTEQTILTQARRLGDIYASQIKAEAEQHPLTFRNLSQANRGTYLVLVVRTPDRHLRLYTVHVTATLDPLQVTSDVQQLPLPPLRRGRIKLLTFGAGQDSLLELRSQQTPRAIASRRLNQALDHQTGRSDMIRNAETVVHLAATWQPETIAGDPVTAVVESAGASWANRH